MTQTTCNCHPAPFDPALEPFDSVEARESEGDGTHNISVLPTHAGALRTRVGIVNHRWTRTPFHWSVEEALLADFYLPPPTVIVQLERIREDSAQAAVTEALAIIATYPTDREHVCGDAPPVPDPTTDPEGYDAAWAVHDAPDTALTPEPCAPPVEPLSAADFRDARISIIRNLAIADTCHVGLHHGTPNRTTQIGLLDLRNGRWRFRHDRDGVVLLQGVGGVALLDALAAIDTASLTQADAAVRQIIRAAIQEARDA